MIDVSFYSFQSYNTVLPKVLFSPCTDPAHLSFAMLSFCTRFLLLQFDQRFGLDQPDERGTKCCLPRCHGLYLYLSYLRPTSHVPSDFHFLILSSLVRKSDMISYFGDGFEPFACLLVRGQ